VFGVFQGPRSPALRRPRRGLARGRRASAGAPLSAFTQLVVRRQDQERPSRAGLALFSFLWVGGLVQPGCSVRGRPAYLLEPQHGAGASLLYVEDGTASFLFVGAAAEAGLGSGEQEGRWRSRWRSRAQPPGRAGSAGQEGRTRSLLTLPTLLALDPDVALSFMALSGARVGTQLAFRVNAQGPDRVQLLCSCTGRARSGRRRPRRAGGRSKPRSVKIRMSTRISLQQPSRAPRRRRAPGPRRSQLSTSPPRVSLL